MPDKIDPAKLRYIESRARAIAKLLDTQIHATTTEKYGFALLIFSFQGPELTYISNAERADMIQALRELLEKWETGNMSDFPGGIDARN